MCTKGLGQVGAEFSGQKKKKRHCVLGMLGQESKVWNEVQVLGHEEQVMNERKS